LQFPNVQFQYDVLLYGIGLGVFNGLRVVDWWIKGATHI